MPKARDYPPVDGVLIALLEDDVEDWFKAQLKDADLTHEAALAVLAQRRGMDWILSRLDEIKERQRLGSRNDADPARPPGRHDRSH